MYVLFKPRLGQHSTAFNKQTDFSLTRRKLDPNARKGDVEAEYYYDLYETELLWNRQLYLMATSMFKWGNLPNGITSRYLERMLTDSGQLVWYFSEAEGGVTCSGGAPYGDFNKFFEATRFNILNPTFNMEAESIIDVSSNIDELDIKLGVIMGNNDIKSNETEVIEHSAHQLAEVEMTIKQNLRAQAQPYFLRASTKNKLTVMNIFKKIFYGEPYILADKDFDKDTIDVLNTHTPLIITQVRDEFYHRHSLALTRLGIQNLNNRKSERMIVDEANANNGQIELMAQTKLNSRLEAIEIVNKRFEKYLDKPITVELRDDLNFNTAPVSLNKSEALFFNQEGKGVARTNYSEGDEDNG